MADETRDVVIRISAKNLVGEAFAQAKKEVGGLQKGIADFGRGATSAGRALLPFSAALGAIGIGAVKMATDLNAGMANVATLIPGNTARVQELKTAVQEMAIATGKSTTDLSSGLYQVVSAFGDTSDTAKVLDINARAAAAGLATTLDAINLTSAVTKAYGDTSAAAVQKASDLAFVTVKLGQTTFPELASAIGLVAPIAATLKVRQEELSAGFATLTGVTGSASQVSTQMRAVLASMLKPTKEMETAIAALGFSSSSAMVEQLGMVGAMNALIGTTDGSEKSVGKLFGSVEGLSAVFALTGGQADTFTSKLAAMEQASGATDEAFREQTEGVNAAGFAWEQFKARLQVTMQKLGDTAIPILMNTAEAMKPLLDKVMGAVDWFGKLPQPVQTVGVVLAGLMVAAAPVLLMVGTMASGVAALSGAFGTMGIAAGALTGMLWPLTAAVLAVGAAFVGWQIGKAIGQLQVFGLTLQEWVPVLWNWKLGLGETSLENLKLAETSRRLAGQMAVLRGENARTTDIQLGAAGAATGLSAALGTAAAATTKLTDEQKKAKEALDKLIASLSGQEAMNAAQQYVDAVTRMGGATTLSESAMQDVHKAMAAVTAAGGTLTPAMAALEVATRALIQPTKQLAVDYLALAPAIDHAKASTHAYVLAAEQGVDALFASTQRAKDVQAELMRIGAIAPSIVSNNASQMVTKAEGFFSKIFGGAQGMVGNLNSLFTSAFTGGGGAVGAFKGLATQALGSLMSLIPGVGPFLSQFSGAIVAGLGKIGGAIKSLFGGPSGAELQGRKAFGQYVAGVKAAMDEGQLDEVAQNVAKGWKESLAVSAVAIQHAFGAAGRSAAEADAFIHRLWDAQKRGGRAVADVIADIARITGRDLTQATKTAEAATVSATTTATVGYNKVKDRIDALRDQAIGTKNEGLIQAVHALEAKMEAAAASGTEDFSAMADEIEGMAKKIADTPIIIKVGWDAEDFNVSDFIKRNPGDTGRAESAGGNITDPQMLALLAGEFDDAIRAFIAREGRDDMYARGQRALGLGQIPEKFFQDYLRGKGFRDGTPALDYMPFGSGRWAQLHGEEAVIPRGAGHHLAAEIAAALGGRGAGGVMEIRVITQLDSRVVAEQLVPVLPGALKRRGYRL